MADAPAVDLSYGHFGTPLYDPEAKHWIFQRRPRKHQLLISLASSKVFPSANTHQAETEILDTIGAKALGHHIKTLARNNPELAPALELLPDLAKVSASIVSVVSTYNPAVGDLLAFGRNDDIDTERARARYRIAATPYGETGNILRITHVREDQYGWGHDKGVWLNVPCLHEETSWSGWWPGSGAPIQQICFGDSDGSASFMAVRMPTETIIFRPLFRSTPVQTGTSQSPRLPPSRLDPNPVLHIPISKTGRLPQADVCFNPWFPRQLAFVDEEGSWSVWDLEGQARRINNYCVSPFCFGTIVPPKSVEAIPDEAMPEFDEPSGSPEDGWARILWIGDVNTIVVCNRRHMAVFVINGGKEKARRLKCPELGFARTASWILDIRRSPQNQNRFFVLTSTMLHLVEIRFQDVGLGRSSSESEAIVLLSWRHFRGAEDVSLQMRLCQARAEDTNIFVFSRLNPLISVFQCSQSVEEPSSLPTSSMAPTHLKLPHDLTQLLRSGKRIHSLSVEYLHFGEDVEVEGDGPGRDYIENDNVCFYSLYVILDDFSLHKILAHSWKVEDNDRSDCVVKIPGWRQTDSRITRGTMKQKLKNPHKSAELVSEDDEKDISTFIVPNGTLKQSGIRNFTTGYSRPKPTPSRLLEWTDDDPWTVNNELIYDEMRGPFVCFDRNGTPPEDAITCLEQIRVKLDEDDNQRVGPFGTLLDLMQSPIQVADIDDVSSKFDQLFRSPLNKTNPDLPQLEIRTLPLTLDYAVHESDGDPSIASVYDELLRTYIAPLPRKIPPQLRQAKEKLARLISADLLLASSKIHVIETQQPIAEETQAESMETTELTLPVRSSGKSKMRALSEPRSMNSQPDSYNQMSAFPTPDPTPSLASGSTFTSSTQGLNDTPYARLRQHLHITKAHGFAQSDQDALNQVLLHWKHNFGQNPSSYEWEATTKIIHESMTSNDDDNMTATQRARLQRKAERHLKRQRRETAAAEAASSMRPFATIETKSQFHSLEPVASQRFPISPSIPLKSSPGPFRNETSQNKQESSQPAISTQVERGVFGGRPERKKKKKKKGQLPGFR